MYTFSNKFGNKETYNHTWLGVYLVLLFTCAKIKLL